MKCNLFIYWNRSKKYDTQIETDLGRLEQRLRGDNSKSHKQPH